MAHLYLEIRRRQLHRKGLGGEGLMKALELLRRALLYASAAALFLAGVGSGRISLAAQGRNQDEELMMGQEIFNELKADGEIVESSPLYDQLRPIADAISRAAQPQYDHPLNFYLLHEDLPDAFAAPGGNLYVVDSLLYFVRNSDELAGTLCHEVSHTIHHDTVTKMRKKQKIAEREARAAKLLGADRAQRLGIPLIAKLHSLGYSRYVESRADLTGSDICAAAGYNPWGLVWLFQDFQNSDLEELPQLLSDHPDFQHRVNLLEWHFRANPWVFRKFSSDPKSARPISVSKSASEVFLH
jgi:predicted Zn-dependent protease